MSIIKAGTCAIVIAIATFLNNSLLVTSVESIESLVSPQALFQKYHDDRSCRLDEYRANKDVLIGRRNNDFYTSLRPLGSIDHIANRKTTICPIPGNQQRAVATASTTTASSGTKLSPIGLDTVWIVENQASTPIVLCWIEPESGKEYAAANSKVSPPTADPDSIMQPGDAIVIDTHEGQSFLARALINGTIMGPVLLHHTVGLVPVGRPGDIYQCNEQKDEGTGATDSTETLEDEFHDDVNGNENDIHWTTLEEPMFERPEASHRPVCHTIELGFRNMINCPVVGYFVEQVQDADDETVYEQEDPKFYLGTQSSGLDDYMHDWDSTTKYESTYMGHTFRFRLESDPNVIVDTIQIQPTIVRDCPLLQAPVASTIKSSMVSTTVSMSASSSTQSMSLYSKINANNESSMTAEGYYIIHDLATLTIAKGYAKAPFVQEM